jgi:hypothetical protein
MFGVAVITSGFIATPSIAQRKGEVYTPYRESLPRNTIRRRQETLKKLTRAWIGGRVKDLTWRPNLDEVARSHEVDGVRGCFDTCHFVRDDDHGCSLSGKLSHYLEHLPV